MFYFAEVDDHVRVEPKLFGLPTMEAVDKQLRETYHDHYDKEMGKVISVIDVLNVGEGILIPGDGAAYYKTNALLGKSTKRTLKPGDLCVARIIALSHKGNDPKIGLTMRQPGLGKIEWIKEDQAKKERDAKKAERAEEKVVKGGKKKKNV